MNQTLKTLASRLSPSLWLGHRRQRRQTGRSAAPLGKPLLAALTGAMLLSSGPALAQSDMVRVLVGFPAGSGTDTLARIYAGALSELTGMNTVVENRPGAGGLLAAQALARSDAQSPMVMMTIDHQVVMLPLILKEPGFDVRDDLAPIARLMTFNTCMAVNSASPATTLQEYVELAKNDPAQANYGVPAPGSQAHFVGFVIGQHYDVDLQAIPYKGAAPAITDLLGNQVPSIIVPCDALTDHVRAGAMRVLGIAADERSPLYPDAPTFVEQGLEMPTDNFVGIYASAKLDAETRDKLVAATEKMFDMPETLERFNNTGMRANYGSPEDLLAIWEESASYWAKQVEDSNFQAQ